MQCHRQVRYDSRYSDCCSCFVKPGTDAEKVHWTLRQVGTLELLSDWLDFVWRYLGFWLRATVSYLSRWMDEHGDICKPIFTVRRALWSLYWWLPVWFAYVGYGTSFGRSVVGEQDACDVSRPWRVSFANLGPCWLDILYYQKAGMEFNGICSIGALQSILRDG